VERRPRQRVGVSLREDPSQEEHRVVAEAVQAAADGVPGGEGVHGIQAVGVRLAGESRQQLQHRRALRSVPADNRLELRGRSASPANDDDRRCRGVARLEGRWHVGAEEGTNRIRNLCGRVAVPQRTELPCGRGLGLRLWLGL